MCRSCSSAPGRRPLGPPHWLAADRRKLRGPRRGCGVRAELAETPEVARKSLRFHARFSVQEHTYLLCADDTVTTSDAHDRLSTSTATSFSNTARQHPECSTGNSKTRRHELKHSTQHTDLRTPHTHTQGTHCAKREAGCARNRGLRTTRSPHGVDAVHTHCTRARKHTRTRHTSRRDTEPERGGEGEHAAAPFDGPGQKLSGGA
jgi:hypothetical protein